MSDKETVAVSRYDGDPDDWSYGDAKVGHSVPASVRRSGAYKPAKREPIGENGMSTKCHSVKFECEECGSVRRFATTDHVLMYNCKECGGPRFFRFRWGLNR